MGRPRRRSSAVELRAAAHHRRSPPPWAVALGRRDDPLLEYSRHVESNLFTIKRKPRSDPLVDTAADYGNVPHVMFVRLVGATRLCICGWCNATLAHTPVFDVGVPGL